MKKGCFSFVAIMLLFSLKAASQLHFPQKHNGFQDVKKLVVLPQNFYSQHQAYTCKKEGQLQKHTGLNLFLRLGSKDYVDYLERKPNAIRP
jgi:hypothetical protein